MKTCRVPVTVFISPYQVRLESAPSSILFLQLAHSLVIAAYWLYTRYFSLWTLGMMP